MNSRVSCAVEHVLCVGSIPEIGFFTFVTAVFTVLFLVGLCVFVYVMFKWNLSFQNTINVFRFLCLSVLGLAAG
jgi:hypothetical protein